MEKRKIIQNNCLKVLKFTGHTKDDKYHGLILVLSYYSFFHHTDSLTSLLSLLLNRVAYTLQEGLPKWDNNVQLLMLWIEYIWESTMITTLHRIYTRHSWRDHKCFRLVPFDFVYNVWKSLKLIFFGWKHCLYY